MVRSDLESPYIYCLISGLHLIPGGWGLHAGVAPSGSLGMSRA
jgi:hypothetical protein